MKRRIVICRNDFPFAVLPETATERQALGMVDRLREDPKSNNGEGKIYWHFLTVPVTEEPEKLL